MKKEHKQIIKDAMENIEAVGDKFHDFIAEVVPDIDREIENLGHLHEELEEAFDEMSEAQQEADKGQKAQEEMSEIESLISDLGTTKDELETAPFDDLLERLKTIFDEK